MWKATDAVIINEPKTIQEETYHPKKASRAEMMAVKEVRGPYTQTPLN